MEYRFSRSLKYACLTGIFLLASTGVSAAKFYRYTDDSGKTVVSSSLPPSAAQKGYEIVNELGIVLEVIAPRKTDEQLRQEAIEAEKRAQEQARLDEQKRFDTILINSYTDISDIERARDNELESKDRDIMMLKQNIRRYTRLLEDNQALAARDERLGKSTNPKLAKEITVLKRRISRENKEVVEVQEHKERINDRYNSSIIRFSELKATERLKKLRANRNNLQESQSIFSCDSLNACDNAWSAALRFASEYSTTELAWANDTTIMMRKPQTDKDISIVMTRVNGSSGNSADIVMEVRCNKSIAGDNFCASTEIQSIKDSFNGYLASGPTKRP